MNTTTIDDVTEKTRNGTHRLSKDVQEAKEHMKHTASSELSNLVSDVEDLLKKVTHVNDADIAILRARLERKIEVAKETIAAGSGKVTQTAREAAKATDEYVRQSPWQSVGIAALTGAVVGFAISAFSSRR